MPALQLLPGQDWDLSLLFSLPLPPWQVHHILQEMVIGGMVLETNMNEIVAQVEAQGKLEKAEVSGDAAEADRTLGCKGGGRGGRVGGYPGYSQCLPVNDLRL